jgi:hypothetical protein
VSASGCVRQPEASCLGMVVPQRAVQLGGPEGFRDESDRGTALQRLASCRVNIRADNDRTDAEAIVNLACGLGATSAARETEVHENDVRSVHFCAGDGSILGGRHRTDLMAEIRYELFRSSGAALGLMSRRKGGPRYGLASASGGGCGRSAGWPPSPAASNLVALV